MLCVSIPAPRTAPEPTAAATVPDGPPCPGRHCPTTGEPTWCAPHAAGVRAALRQIPDHLALATRAGDGTLSKGRAADVGVRGPAALHPASPSPALDEVDAVRSWAAEWADTIAALADDRDGRTTGPRRSLYGALAYLDDHLDDALAGPLATELGRDVLRIHDHVQRLAGMEPVRHRMATPCPRCDCLSLVREDGSEVVECTQATCRGLWAQADYQRIVAALLRAHTRKPARERALAGAR